jgi:hypothetical protein
MIAALNVKADLPEEAEVKSAEDSWVQEAQETAKQAIIDKTALGLDADNNAMPPLSEAWRARKARQGFAAGIRDLRYTYHFGAGDALMNSIVAQDNILTVTDDAQGKAVGNNDRAEYFAVGDDTLDVIEEQAIDRFMEELGL